MWIFPTMCTERTILQKYKEYQKILLSTDLKITLLDHQNIYVENSSIMSNAANNFDTLTISFERLKYLMVQQNLFSDLYLAKFLNTLTKS